MNNPHPLLNTVQRFSKFGKLAFTPLAIAFLCYLVFQEAASIADLATTANLNFLIISILLWMLGQLVLPVFTNLVFSRWHQPTNYRQLLLIHTRRLPAKYIPGGVWHSVARSVDYANIGLSNQKLITYFLLENLLAAGATLALGGLIILSYATERDWTYLTILTITASATLVLIVGPKLMAARIPGDEGKLTSPNYLVSLGVVWLFWIVAASSFVCFLLAFGTIEIINKPLLVGGIYMFSWGIGFLAIFSPQGLGIFELVAATLINAEVSIGYLVTLITGFRVVVLIGDIGVWGVVTLVSTGKGANKTISNE